MYQEHPLLEEIERIAEEHLNGCLKLRHEDEMMEIHFRGGLIEAVSSNLVEYRLGQYLLREGSLNLSKLNRLLRKSRKRERSTYLNRFLRLLLKRISKTDKGDD